ncbi:protein PAM68, chloroplastic [Corylus avellana]|uniref:protein PAM68, chloroplastic n=1 Tax=Corylus avellana TaxID=13451 RepID=UPI001E23E30A|nr:protein PAM68, chloroplastic [Corylus avellana]
MSAITGASSSQFRLSLTSSSNPTSAHKIERKLCTLPISITAYSLERHVETQYPISATKPYHQNQTSLYATLRSSKGFGRSPRKTKKTKKPKKDNDDDEEEEEEEAEEEVDEGVIPEVVTNRMISRMGFSVGTPLFIGVLFFPFFYYLKVGLKIDVPTWVPFIVSFFFFGSALLGVSYGIVSASWDPMREGSLLGWNEARKNWPVFWQSLRGRSGKQ